jgi:hypothetical protein
MEDARQAALGLLMESDKDYDNSATRRIRRMRVGRRRSFNSSEADDMNRNEPTISDSKSE